MKIYHSRYGKIVKSKHHPPQYWHHGELIVSGVGISNHNQYVKPTKADWQYCGLILREGKK